MLNAKLVDDQDFPRDCSVLSNPTNSSQSTCAVIMALAVPASARLSELLILKTTPILPSTFRSWPSRQLAFTLPAITINVPRLISDIWEGILKAVPKKKTSHSKKRHRQLAGKALKDVKAINNCPGCGRPKKAHTLCPYCVAGSSRLTE